MKTKNIGLGFVEMKCPCCQSKIIFTQLADNYGIKVNCESEGEVHVPKMYHIWRKCNNPLCKWSKIEENR